MTGDEPTGTDDPLDSLESTGDDAETTTDAERPISAADRIEALADRVAELERTIAWMARQQAAETGNSICPSCRTGGALKVNRTPTGKKQVECSNCGEKIN